MLRVLGDLSLSKLLDLLSDDLDSSFIGSIELQNPLLVELLPEELLGHREHRGGLSCSWWTVHQQVWHLTRLDGDIERRDHLKLM